MKQVLKKDNETIEEYFNRVNELTLSEIKSMYKEGTKVNWLKIIIRTIQTFINSFIIRKYFMKGVSGFIKARLEAIATLILYSKLWEYQIRNKSE